MASNIGTINLNARSYHKPIEHGNAVYVCGIDSTNNYEIDCMKSTTPSTGSWTEQDTVDVPADGVNPVLAMSYKQNKANARYIDVAWASDSGGGTGANYRINYARFDMDTDSWVTADEATGLETTTATKDDTLTPYIDIDSNSDDDLIILGPFDSEKEMGVDYARVGLWRHNTGGSWVETAANTFDSNQANAQIDYFAHAIAYNNNDKTWNLYYSNDSGTGNTYRIRLNDADTLSARDLVVSNYGANGALGATYWNDGTDDYDAVYLNGTGGTDMYHEVNQGGTWTNREFENVAKAGGIVADDTDDQVYGVYSRITDDDLVYSISDNGGVPPATGTLIETATANAPITPNIIDYGSGKVLAVVYNNGTTARYAEITLDATQTITHSGLSQGTNYGTHRFNQQIQHSGVSQSINYGTQELILNIIHTALVQALSFGTHRLNVSIQHSGVSVTIVYGSQELISDQFITHSGLSQIINYGTHLLEQFIVHTGVSQTLGFGTHILNLNLQPTGLSVSTVYGTHIFDQFINHTAVSQSVLFGTHLIEEVGILSIHPPGLSVPPVYGAHKLNQFIDHTAIAQSVDYGVGQLGLTIGSSGLSQSVNYGTHIFDQFIQQTGLSVAPDYGVHLLNQLLIHSGLLQDISYGNHLTLLNIQPLGLTQVTSYGTHIFDQFLVHQSLVQIVNYGTHEVRDSQEVSVPGIPQNIDQGTHILSMFILQNGVSQSINYGGHSLFLTLSPIGISQSTNYGTHIFDQFIQPGGLTQSINFGLTNFFFIQTLTHSGLLVSPVMGDHTITGIFNLIPPNSTEFILLPDNSGAGEFVVVNDNNGEFVIIP